VTAILKSDQAKILGYGGWCLGFLSGVAQGTNIDFLRRQDAGALSGRLYSLKQADKPLSVAVEEIARSLIAELPAAPTPGRCGKSAATTHAGVSYRSSRLALISAGALAHDADITLVSGIAKELKSIGITPPLRISPTNSRSVILAAGFCLPSLPELRGGGKPIESMSSHMDSDRTATSSSLRRR
jgi:hypothetical protein